LPAAAPTGQKKKSEKLTAAVSLSGSRRKRLKKPSFTTVITFCAAT